MKKALLLLLAVSMTATGSVPAGAEGLTFGVTYWCQSEFFGVLADGITQAAAAEGNKTVIVDAEQDAARQI